MNNRKLIQKYNVPAPRYTSYPTVPLWNKEVIGQDKWMHIVKKTFDETNHTRGISLYIHLPFCESLCTYCGCNKRITKNHNVEEPYIEALLKEWQLYLHHLRKKPVIRELHLGGGTPTFFSPENLRTFLEELFPEAAIHPAHDFSFEGHPNNTTSSHLQVLYDLGFRRVSYGIQDLDPKVQKAIHRIQPFDNVLQATKTAREVGFTSINFDLIYGLPFQSEESISTTLDKVAELMPERIAFYSYAHVPWKSPAQRGYSEADLPHDEYKRKLYEIGREKLLSIGYADIGMDHFALPNDTLYHAAQNGHLHRNFMGYTVSNTELLIGLGASAISDAKFAYMQNEKVVETYQDHLSKGKIAILKSHTLSEKDLIIRSHILKLLCTGTLYCNGQFESILTKKAKDQFATMQMEGLIIVSKEKLQVTGLGKAFIRNIAMVLDARLNDQMKPSQPQFSKAI